MTDELTKCQLCDNKAIFGIDSPIYCSHHAYDKKMIDFRIQCYQKDCKHNGIYLHTPTHFVYCEIHSKQFNEKSIRINYMDFRNVIPTDEKIGTCKNCDTYCSVLFECNCGVKRCYECAYMFSWKHTIEKKVKNKIETKNITVCKKCYIPTQHGNIPLLGRTDLDINLYCSDTKCCNFADYYTFTNKVPKYYCYLHKPRVVVKEKCYVSKSTKKTRVKKIVKKYYSLGMETSNYPHIGRFYFKNIAVDLKKIRNTLISFLYLHSFTFIHIYIHNHS